MRLLTPLLEPKTIAHAHCDLPRRGSLVLWTTARWEAAAAQCRAWP
jgi:hypothetical protein